VACCCTIPAPQGFGERYDAIKCSKSGDGGSGSSFSDGDCKRLRDGRQITPSHAIGEGEASNCAPFFNAFTSTTDGNIGDDSGNEDLTFGNSDAFTWWPSINTWKVSADYICVRP
jgi:hypothetical protein